MSYRELLLLTMLLLSTMDTIGCMACTLVRIAVELLRVRVVHSWMRASTPAAASPPGWLAFVRGSVVGTLKTNFRPI